MAKAKKKTKSVKAKSKKAASKPAARKTKKATKKAVKKTASKGKTKSPKAKAKKSSPAPKKATRNWQVYLAPLYDKVLLRKFKDEDTTVGGLYIPGIHSDGPLKAEVLAVGKGLLQKKGRIRPLDVKVGDSIVYSAYAGTSIRVDDIDLVIIKEEEILGIVE